MSKLYIVGTPIGNLGDITMRAIETLKSVDVIACEDTRVTRKLLNHYKIEGKKLIAYHDKNEKASANGIIKMLHEGKSVAQVSDAGMPVVNDPGFEIIRQAIREKIDFEVIPGPSATLTALALSNFNSHFTFLGFLKPKTEQRKNQLKKLTAGTYVAFASPHRLEQELKDIEEALGADIKIFLGRELTKKFETHYRGVPSDVLEQVKDHIKGEFTLVFEIPKRKVNKYDKQ